MPADLQTELVALLEHFEARGLTVADATAIMALQLGICLKTLEPNTQCRHVRMDRLAKGIREAAELTPGRMRLRD